jgi:hypothetical protein
MAKGGYFGHESPEGDTLSERYGKARYICAVREGRTTYRGAENIWRGSRYASVKIVNGAKTVDWNSESKIARAVVDEWMKSPGHRANILTPAPDSGGDRVGGRARHENLRHPGFLLGRGSNLGLGLILGFREIVIRSFPARARILRNEARNKNARRTARTTRRVQ